MTIQIEATESFATPERDANKTERPVDVRASDFVRSIARSPDYANNRRAGVPHSEAFVVAAELFIEDEENELSNADRLLFTLVKDIGGFVEADAELSKSRTETEDIGKRPTVNQIHYRRGLKKNHLIPFNHTVKSLIDEDSNVPIKGLAVTLARSYGTIFGKSQVLNKGAQRDEKDLLKLSDVAQKIETTVDGMRHEIAAETMLSTLGVEYNYDTTVDDDAKGIDLKVMIDGRFESIDLKKSLNAERKAHEARSSSHAVWTGLEYSDFRGMKNDTPGALAISYDRATEKAPAFYERILNTLGNRGGTFGHDAARRFVR